jgi:hypothetical protein
MNRIRPLTLGAALALLAPTFQAEEGAPHAHALNRQTFHLRSGTTPEWDEFAAHAPDGTNLVLRFAGHTNDHEATLLIQQDNVKLDWGVELNGKKLGTLFLMEAPLIHALPVPPGLLHDGENTFSLTPPKDNDDILVGRVSLIDQPRREALHQAAVDIDVRDRDSGSHLPCRITIVDAETNLTALAAEAGQKLAVRPGIVYTPNVQAKVGLLPGEYTAYATRGFEYGLGAKHFSVAAGETARVALTIRREVPTPHWVSSDTHVHTGTYARHGDATVDERAVTLAGEGIELPISTEHDSVVDLAGAAFRSGVQDWLTPVVGEEVTTAQGHFNIFPVDIMAPLPDKSLTDWPRLMQALRATPGTRVVILNHPRNIHSGFQPFAATNFNAITGENLRGFQFTFDAIEVANSSALQSDWMVNFRDWFALLNYGYRFTAVGSSDVHDVSRYIVGQGRTYIATADTRPDRINVSTACRSLKEGRALVSLGLLTQMMVDQRFEVGDLVTNVGGQLRVDISVRGPSWVQADQVELFANGVPIRAEKIEPSSNHSSFPGGESPVNSRVSWLIDRPKHDVYLVALATGPAVTAAYWALARPYQPSSPTWRPRVLGATNPIWVDVDGDGKFTAPRAYAQRLVAECGTDPRKLFEALAGYDEAVAAQTASVWQAQGTDIRGRAIEDALGDCPGKVRRGFESFRATLPGAASTP